MGTAVFHCGSLTKKVLSKAAEHWALPGAVYSEASEEGVKIQCPAPPTPIPLPGSLTSC